MKNLHTLVTYGWLAHWLNLLGQDLTPTQVIKHVTEVNKYFRNHHIPAALLKPQLGSVRPQLPGDTRWGSQLTACETFLKNRTHYLQIVQDHGDDVDRSVAQKIMDMNLFHQVRDLASQLQPISEAITRAQKDNTNLADACDIFFALLEEPQLRPHKDLVEKWCILPSLHWKEFFPFQHISIVTSTFKVQ